MKTINSGIMPEIAVKKAVIQYKGKYIKPIKVVESSKNEFKAQWVNGSEEMWILVTYEKAGWRLMLNQTPDFGSLKIFSPFLMNSVELLKNLVALFEEYEKCYGSVL